MSDQSGVCTPTHTHLKQETHALTWGEISSGISSSSTLERLRKALLFCRGWAICTVSATTREKGIIQLSKFQTAAEIRIKEQKLMKGLCHVNMSLRKIQHYFFLLTKKTYCILSVWFFSFSLTFFSLWTLNLNLENSNLFFSNLYSSSYLTVLGLKTQEDARMLHKLDIQNRIY